MQGERSQKALSAPSEQGERRQLIVLTEPNIKQEVVQIAKGDIQAQHELGRIVRGYRDPRRVLNAVLKMAGELVPGAKIVVAVLEAAHDLFGPAK